MLISQPLSTSEFTKNFCITMIFWYYGYIYTKFLPMIDNLSQSAKKTTSPELEALIKLSGMDQTDILNQIWDGWERWHTLAEVIRKEFETEDKIYNNEKRNKDKIGDNTYFAQHNALMAREYVSRPTTAFQATSPAQLNQVKNLNAAKDADFATSEYENLRYQMLDDKYRRGVGIGIRKWWDGFKKMPKMNAVDPRLAIFDPDGNYVTGDYAFFGFEKHDYINALDEQGFFNLQNISTESGDTDWPKYVQQRDQENADLNRQFGVSISDPAVRTYYHFDTFGGQRALVVTWNSQTEIIKVIILDDVEELKAFEDVLAFKYWRQDRNNPYGKRIAKLGVADLQRVKAEYANLRLDKARAELYPMYTYNTRLIKNKADLDFGFNKLVPTTPLEGESLNNAIQPINRDFRADNSFVIDNSLDSQVADITSISALAQGSSPERREAATTNKLLQDNTDINLAFNAKLDALGEEKLMRVWLAGYLEKLEDWDTKLIYIETWYGTLPRELTKKDFITDLAVKIKIETVVEIEERNQTDRVAYAQMIGFLQAIPNRPESAQLNTMRNFGRSWGMSDAALEMELPQTAQELVAHDNIWLLLAGESVEVRDDYDPDTHLLMIQAAWNGDNVEMYRYGLLKLKKIQGKTEAEQTDPSVANNLAAQASAQASNEAVSLNNNQ